MMHMLFLLGSGIMTLLLQVALLALLSWRTRWQEERSIPLLALALPGIGVLLFSLLMVPDFLIMIHHVPTRGRLSSSGLPLCFHLSCGQGHSSGICFACSG